MQSDLPKVLHQIGGAPLFYHAIQSGQSIEPEKVVLVVGHGADMVQKTTEDFGVKAEFALQSEQLGTGHAVAQATSFLDGFTGDAVVLYGDNPFITTKTLNKMKAARADFDVVVLGFEPEDALRYGRLVMADGRLEKIVEFKDATAEERAITLCNSGVIMADASVMTDLVAAIDNNNASGEYYLTDIVALANARGLVCTAVKCPADETLGVDSRAQLAKAEGIFQDRKRAEALENGVTLRAPDTTYFSYDTVLGRDVEVEQNVVFAPGVTVETGARIRAFSHLEGCHVSKGAIIGESQSPKLCRGCDRRRWRKPWRRHRDMQL